MAENQTTDGADDTAAADAGSPAAAVEPAGAAPAEPAEEPVVVPRAVASSEPGAGTVAERPNRRKVREGLVVSTAMDKTAVVAVTERVRHSRYAKTVQRTRKLYVHDAGNEAMNGDRVRVAETRPLSKNKRWRLVEILERAR